MPTPATPVVLACFDKFRSTASASDLCRVVADVAWERGLEALVRPMADGGEGTIGALSAQGGRLRRSTVTGPLGEPVEAVWLMRDRTAIIEMAQASGLDLVGGPDRNRPLDATTYGTGQLIAEALVAGAKRIVVTLGGSATTDGGLGALNAMAPLARFRGVDFLVACDVQTTFTGAATDFGPQKGASPAQVGLLTRRLEQLADRYVLERGIDIRSIPGTGAAGGLAGALVSIGARVTSGFSFVAEEVGLVDAIAAADIVYTGEGRCDTESFNGKVVGGVCELARDAGVPVVVIAGDLGEDFVLPSSLDASMISVVSLTERFGAAQAWNAPLRCVREVVSDLLP